MFASTTLNADELMNIINSTLEELENDSNETSTSVKSNFTITGNKIAAHDGRLGNTEGSWCASGNSSDGEHHLIVDIGMRKLISLKSEQYTHKNLTSCNKFVHTFLITFVRSTCNNNPVNKLTCNKLDGRSKL